ncbi:hypothetical protein BOTBODRAFT_178036 [Botryobasidium botryosum FD-172 SS1]|uniref:Nascent polypeptide-associated complex subunit alpha-like UBA domain-containing protein n=1 Tax=Botryobasidium botryosum (strain FD-172 SS1) TaxID=930990 RepID=A0A067MG52_BOTB1|nr:hypothetical protein BOTBODRAFT_178036 [Botryobasidium botryosum FD-172 SS1]
MTTTVARNGLPEAEVILNFADGFSYSKNRLDDAVADGIFEKPAAIKDKESIKPKEADVDLIVSELEISRFKAEKALIASEGDLVGALKSLCSPPSI